MFRKIHSNRDPNDTLFSEIKKEFGEYFGKAETHSKVFLERHTRMVFKVMVGMLIISVVLSFTVFRKRDQPVKSIIAVKPHQPATAAQPAVISDGFSRIMQVGSALREMIALKKQVDSITTKKALTPQDSLVLEKDLDRLQQINNRPQGAHEHLEKNN
jgi:hypothetical protein